MTIVKEAQSSRVSAALDRAEARPVALDLPLEHDERLRRALESEVEKLVDEFGAVLPPSVVESEFAVCVRSFESARIRIYVPVLSYRNARQALRQRAIGTPDPPKRTG